VAHLKDLLLQTIAEHFFAPRNVGDAHEPSFTGRASSLRCGATCRFSIQIGEANQILEAKFKVAGCHVLVAALSQLTDLVKDKTTAEAASLGQDEQLLPDCFGTIPEERIPCIAVASEALLRAVRAYSDAVRSEWNGDEALVCTCFCVSERTIEETIRDHGLTTVAEVTKLCYAGGGCGSCHSLIQDMLEVEGGGPAPLSYSPRSQTKDTKAAPGGRTPRS
jgi:NifU-like protein